MRAPWAKLGALSRKINPLGTSNQNQFVVDIARNNNGDLNGNGLGAHSVSAALGETSPRPTEWSFRRCGQNGCRSTNHCESAGKPFIAVLV